MRASWWHTFKPEKPHLDQEAKERFKSREGRMNDVVFRGACDLAKVEPTVRQARKWNNGRGLAIKFKNKAKELL